MKSPALRYLDARARFGMKFGLETMRALMEALGQEEAMRLIRQEASVGMWDSRIVDALERVVGDGR